MGRLAVLREHDFRVFFAGFATSVFGSAMASVALAFAVLDRRGSVTDLSYVLAARIVPVVVFLLLGGVLGDRLPRRWVMLAADVIRAVGMGGIAGLFIAGDPPLWPLLVLSALCGVGEALFTPCLEGLIPALVPADRLGDANAVIGLARSTAAVAGPALAGVLVAVVGSPAVVTIDAATYLVSVLALVLLRVPAPARSPATPSLLTQLREGWTVFRAHTWLWAFTMQAALFNLVVWAPYLVLGPAVARSHYSGASAWGTIMTGYGTGAILGGLALLGRRPRRPLVVSAVIGFGYAAPSACLVLTAPLPVVVAGAVVAGLASAVSGALWSTTVQQRVPAEALSRVNSYVYFGAFVLGPVGLAAAGPVAAASGVGVVLAAGVVWQLVANSAIIALPAVRRLGQPEPLVSVDAARTDT